MIDGDDDERKSRLSSGKGVWGGSAGGASGRLLEMRLFFFSFFLSHPSVRLRGFGGLVVDNR